MTSSDADPASPRPGNGLAIAALVCGILGFFCITGIAAIVLGIIALVQRQSIALSVTGIVLGALLSFASIIAAIAIPGLLESRIAANEAAAAARLRSGIFVAQTIFQSKATIDADRDGRGDYGDLAALVEAKLVDATLADPGQPYRYTIYTAQDDGFVAYATPRDPNLGRRAFAITANGMVYASRATVAPAAAVALHERGALWGGKPPADLNGEPAAGWTPYQRSGPGRAGDRP